MKKHISKLFARVVLSREQKYYDAPHDAQRDVLSRLLKKGRKTLYGRERGIDEIRDYETFRSRMPVVVYDDLRGYIERIAGGEKDVLYPGRPAYFAKTSGTTSGSKYIPLTSEGLSHQIKSTRNMLLRYILKTGNIDYVGGKMIFLQGSPALEEKNGIKIGRLSGIVAHHVPSYLQSNRKPSFKTNCIEDWESKVEAVVDETIGENMTLISGIPSWLQMYFERLMNRSGKKIGEMFPGFSLMVTGGVSYEPYRARFEEMIGRKVDILQTYPASEGFMAASDSPNADDMLLEVHSGIFYEFIPVEEYGRADARRLPLWEVEEGVNYAVILTTDSGLWAYSIGDTVMFTSRSPYRVRVTGRVSHFTSAFGEHVIGKEVEQAMSVACRQTGAVVREFSVAPMVTPVEGLPYHEWVVEFEKMVDLQGFASCVDEEMQKQNVYYRDLIEGKILRSAVISAVSKGAFDAYMKSVGRLGGQNKLPRLSNDRRIADAMQRYIIESNIKTL
ncbi:MAG: GH3 auxin-responsive promoter family protein [Flavobacteriales bacterium]|nr:GH3 auxin-responsive promoter family protein [Flavobacteriales bacterium]MBQ5815680.1 GH3 auxin-responsive promoter family protein [Flavobacteriales bacterium]